MSHHSASLWRAPRARSLLLIGIVTALIGGVSIAAHIYTDLLWYREVGHEAVFWTTLKWQVLAQGLPGFGTACFVLANLGAVERTIGPRGTLQRLAYPLVATAAGVVTGVLRADGNWQLLALWAGRGDFGDADPLFGRDVGFYVFSLPLYERASRWAVETLALAAVATFAAYLAAGVVRPRLARAARAHLLVLGALGLLLVAWRYRLEQFALALPQQGATLPGAGYTAEHVGLPALRILVGLSCVGALLLLYAARRRVPRRPLAMLAALAALAIAAPGVVSRVVERVEVDPQVLARERSYLAASIAATRRAFDLDDVQVREARGAGTVSARELERYRRTIDNVPLWDFDVLRPAMDDLRSLGRYYSYPSVTTDRYVIDGSARTVTLGARTLDLSALGADARGWANDHFAYTHGYGVAAVSSRQADAVGQPRFTEHDFSTKTDPLGLREPRIYFSERLSSAPPYVIVASNRAEVDLPAPGSSAPAYHYDGDGGIELSSTFRRAAFALRFGDARLLLTETITDGSRILLHRDVGDRLRTLAPFLEWEPEPQTAVIDGRIAYLFHGYTTSTRYPYSEPMGRERINYIRAPAYAVVDAFDGSVDLYADASDEPILRAWRAVYPGLFEPFSRMPAELQAHVRYPARLFDEQAAVYAAYHADDPTAFWNGADAWQPAQQLAGPVEVAGDVHFPAVEDAAGDRLRMPARYLLSRLPGDRAERLRLALPFTPRGRHNLVGYLAGSMDEHGHPRLNALSLPRSRLTLGPAQATRQILASSQVSRQLQVVNRESRDLGKAAVSRTVLGDMRVVAIGDALVHVQPVYLIAGGQGLPRLQLVTVHAGGRVGYGQDLKTALRRAIR